MSSHPIRLERSAISPSAPLRLERSVPRAPRLQRMVPRTSPRARLQRMVPRTGYTPGAFQLRVGGVFQAVMIALSLGGLALGTAAIADVIAQIGRAL